MKTCIGRGLVELSPSTWVCVEDVSYVVGAVGDDEDAAPVIVGLVSGEALIVEDVDLNKVIAKLSEVKL